MTSINMKWRYYNLRWDMISDGNVYETIKVVWCDIKMTSYCPWLIHALICHITVVLSKHIGFISVSSQHRPFFMVNVGPCWSMLPSWNRRKPCGLATCLKASLELRPARIVGKIWKQSSEWLLNPSKPRVVWWLRTGFPSRIFDDPNHIG